LFFVFTQSIYSDSTGKRDIVIIFDASGSMTDETTSGETKIDAAKYAVNDFLGGLTSDDRVALIVFYGCEDIRIEATFTTNHSAIAGIVDSIEPYGLTPIKDALLDAWSYLKSYGNTSHSWYIVIFTDGEETCRADPCDAAMMIASESSYYGKTPVYTIGFLIQSGSEAELDLECIASTTGGKYFPASSSEGLRDAFEEISDDITAEEQLTIGEILVYTVISTVLLGGLLVTHTLIQKYSKKGKIEFRDREKRPQRSTGEEAAILWGAADEDEEDELNEEDFVGW
jgi:hypothetical protein